MRLAWLLVATCGLVRAEVWVVKAARLFDGKSNAVVSPGVVVVEGGRIQGVGAPAAPAGAKVIDLGDATLLPGFMDAHTHLRGERSDDNRQDRIDLIEQTVAERTLHAATLARKTLMAGFTTVRDLGGADFIDVGLRNAIRRGEASGPRMLVAVRGIGTTGGHCDPTNGAGSGCCSRGRSSSPWPTVRTRCGRRCAGT